MVQKNEDKLNLITTEDILQAINTVLYNHDLIDKEFYLKCGKPKYITSLPGDLRTNDPELLSQRLDAIETEILNREKILSDAESRINKYEKENTRLGKRVEKSISAMEKAKDNIASESDKIVKNIDKSNYEDKINNWSDDSIDDNGAYIKNNTMIAFNNFRKAHNEFFGKDIEGSNVDDYESSFNDYTQASDTFHQAVSLVYDEGYNMFTKGDVKNSDCSPNFKRISSSIDKYKSEGKKVTEDVQKAESNQQEIDYITKQSKGVDKEIDILMDEFEATHSKYMANGGYERPTPNPQMMVVEGARMGDTFTSLPPNYDKYMV